MRVLKSIRNEILEKGYQEEETQGYKAMRWTFHYKNLGIVSRPFSKKIILK